MKQFILGTAGHIDHGKTSFVKALTGIDTDRLKEEKERGITIELGFAYLKLGKDRLVGIVDVPGHEKFIRHMVAGATGIDLVALIIAADEGVMPQTREHLEICQILGIRHGIVVITKIDMVDEEWLELVKEDIRAFLKGTFLENAPMVEVSSATGQGLDRFLEVLKGLTDLLPEREMGHIFRLPVDRVFTIKGFGTVVTGTTISGKVELGEEVTIYPHDMHSKVRGIQVHGREVKEVLPGTRTALNLQGLEKAVISRGNVVATKDSLRPALSVDCFLELLQSSPYALKTRSDVRFHTGTSEIIGKLILLDRPRLNQGEGAFVHVRLQEPVAVLRGDRFVLRSYSPMRTIGGGIILDPCPPSKRKLKNINIFHLQTLLGNDSQSIVETCISRGEYNGIELSELVYYSNFEEEKVKEIAIKLIDEKVIVALDPSRGPFVHKTHYDNLKGNILSILSEYHASNPLKAGMQKEELKSRSISQNYNIFEVAIRDLVTSGEIVVDKDIVRLREYEIRLDDELEQMKLMIINYYKEAGFMVPTLRELKDKIKHEKLDDLIEVLVRDSVLIKIKDDLFYYRDNIEKLEEKLVGFLRTNETINAGQFKDVTGLSRKYAIPLLEYFDRIQLTVRVGDNRLLRKR